MRRALAVELLKARRSVVVLVTTGLLVLLVPLLCLGFVAAASQGGDSAVALKAQAMVVGEGWEAYLGLLGQIIAVTMFIGPGVVATWAFGREHTDRTFASLFSLPVSRGTTAAAKFVVLLGWGALLSALVLASALLAGVIANVGPLGAVDLLAWIGRLGLAALLTTMIATTLGLAASVGRGYLPAIGVLILLTMLAQVAVLFGTGGWFPFAAPGLFAVGGTADVEVNAVQLLLVPVTALAIAWITIRWWNQAEVT